MNASRAKRRWVRWCRYIDKTQSQANRRRAWGVITHDGQARAYSDVMYAKRYYPKGVREPWCPDWAWPR